MVWFPTHQPDVGGSSRHREGKPAFPSLTSHICVPLGSAGVLPGLHGEPVGTCLAVAFLQLCQSRVQRSEGLPVVLSLDFQQLPDMGQANSVFFGISPSQREPPPGIVPTCRQGKGGASRGPPLWSRDHVCSDE